MFFILTALIAFVLYLILVLWTGSIGIWSIEEIIAGIIFAIIVGFVTKSLFLKRSSLRMLNPIRWFYFIIYCIGPFLLAMAQANWDVACRVITGKIKPGIVKISPSLKTDLGITMLANSITLTPGTLSVDIDDQTHDLYIHWIDVKNKEPDCKDICGNFENWVKRIAE